MNMAYPLFILVACKSDPLKAYKEVAQHEKAAGRSLSLPALPIFTAATWTTTFLLQNLYSMLQVSGMLAQHAWKLAAVLGGALLCCVLHSSAVHVQH